MKKFVSLNNLVDKLKSRGFNTWLDRLTFFRIFLIWTSLIFFFGIIYYSLSNSYGYLLSPVKREIIISLKDSIYFSFITATSTGYGDINPIGFFRIIAITQAICGLLILALVTSKLISIKQDVILSEIYEISFNEKINRLRSSLLVFRQNLGRIINKVEENSLRKRELNDMYVYISSFEDTLNEINSLVGTSTKNYFKKVIDPLNTELLFNSILNSFEKLSELVTILNQSKPEWRRDITLDLMNRCVLLNDNLFAKLNISKNLNEKTMIDLNSQKSKIIDMIKTGLKPPEPVVVLK